MPSLVPLDAGKFYHIYNRGNNRENIFAEEENYLYFLKLYQQHVSSAADTFAYCLLRNHFHFLVRIKPDLTSLVRRPAQAFSNFFNAYARAFNKWYERTGALFERPFKRIEIKSTTHLLHLVAYIHQNPQKHGFVDNFREWPYSSYHALIGNKPTKLARSEVISWFAGPDKFREFHDILVSQVKIAALIPEDFD